MGVDVPGRAWTWQTSPNFAGTGPSRISIDLRAEGQPGIPDAFEVVANSVQQDEQVGGARPGSSP